MYINSFDDRSLSIQFIDPGLELTTSAGQSVYIHSVQMSTEIENII